MPFNALDDSPEYTPASRAPGSPIPITYNGKWMVIPGTDPNGRPIGNEEASIRFFKGGAQPLGEFDTQHDAFSFASNYSPSYQQPPESIIPKRKRREPSVNPEEVVKGWYADPEFKKLSDDEKKVTIGNFFDSVAPPDIKGLPPEEYGPTRTNFVSSMVDLNRPPPPSRGVVSDTLVSIGQGLVGVPSLLARAGAGADELGKYYGITEGTHAKAMRETADAIDKWSQEKMPVSKEAMEKGSFRETWTQGISSTATSLGVSLPMAAVGGLGVIPLVGRGMGAAIGYIMGAPAFGMAQYDQALQDYKKAGLPAGEAHTAALFEGISETGTEALSDALGIITMRMGGLVSKPVKDAARDATRRVIGNTVRGAMARGAGVAIAEEAGELTNAGIQAQVRKQYGEQYGMETQDWWGGVESAFGPVTVSSMIFGALGGGYHKARGSRIVSLLENPGAKVEDRLAAVEEVTRELKRKDPILADVWQANATMAIADGQKISREVTDELITPEKRVAQFVDYYRSQLENGDLSEDDLRFNVSKMRPDSPRAQAIDTVLGREPTTEKPAPRYAGQPGDEEFRQAEPTPQTTPSTPQMRQNEIARQMGYEAPAGPTAIPTPQVDINQRLIAQAFTEPDPLTKAQDTVQQLLGPSPVTPEEARPEPATGLAQDARQWFPPESTVPQAPLTRGQANSVLKRLKPEERGWFRPGVVAQTQSAPPAETPETTPVTKQRLIDRLTGSKAEDRNAWAQWAAAYYAYQNDNGQYVDTPTLIKAMRQDATDMGVPVTNQQIKTVAQEVTTNAESPGTQAQAGGRPEGPQGGAEGQVRVQRPATDRVEARPGTERAGEVAPTVASVQQKVDADPRLKGIAKVDALGEEGTTLKPGMVQVTVVGDHPAKGGSFSVENNVDAVATRLDEEAKVWAKEAAPESPKATLSPTATLSELEAQLSRPLKKIEVTVKYQTAKGRDVEVKQSAKEALTEIDDQLGLARKVLDCIRG